jgi:hypothetical protein
VKNPLLIIINRFFAIAQNDIFELANGIIGENSHEVYFGYIATLLADSDVCVSVSRGRMGEEN